MAAIYDTILDDIMNTLFKKPEQISFEDFQDKYSTGFVQDKGPFGGIKDERHYYASVSYTHLTLPTIYSV